MKKTLLALIVILAVATMSVGATFAGFSDTEEVFDNSFESGSLDLLVAQVTDTWVGDDYRHDLPWGTGLEPSFFIDDVTVCQVESSYIKLWNAGCVDGIALLHFTNVVAPYNVASETTVSIWYDADGDDIVEEIDTGGLETLAELACTYWDLGPLPGDEIRRLRIDLHPEWMAGTYLEFNTLFGLIQDVGSFSDTEESYSYLALHCSVGTLGFWKNWDKHDTYTQSDIEYWLGIIDGDSAWLGPLNILTVAAMVTMLEEASGGTMEQKFLGHYLAQRLNLESGRQDWTTPTHNITSIAGYGYLIPGPSPDPTAATAEEIVDAIEAKEGTGPSSSEFETMKDVCDKLNNVEI